MRDGRSWEGSGTRKSEKEIEKEEGSRIGKQLRKIKIKKIKKYIKKDK